MTKFFETLNSFIPFLDQYPHWVKILFASWILLSSILLMSFVLARSPDTDSSNVVPIAGIETEQEVWLVIKNAELFGTSLSGGHIRVTAIVNQNEYDYPSLAGVEWLEVGPQMSSQQFKIPTRDEGYEVRFSMRLKNGEEIIKLESQETLHIQDLPNEGGFNLHKVNEGVRSASVSARVNYKLTTDPM